MSEKKEIMEYEIGKKGKDEYKRDKKSDVAWMGFTRFIVFVCILIFFLVGAALIYVENKTQLNCLKPYAIEYCSDINSSYIRHDIISFECDGKSYDYRIRGSSVDYYYFLPEEKKKCGIGLGEMGLGGD